MRTYVLGTKLKPEDQRHVLAAYVHRFTGTHKPQWANKLWKEGKPYPVQFCDDADWLAHTSFAIRKDGRLDRRVNACDSRPTWPLGAPSTPTTPQPQPDP